MPNNYDALFIFDQSMDEEGVKKALDRVSEELALLQGTMTGSETIGKRIFARPMKKRETGCYVRASLQLNPESIDPFLARLKLDDEVFRVQITRVNAMQEKTEPEAAPVAEENVDAES